MKKIIVDSYKEMSELAASILLSEMTKDKRTNISITAGATPKGVYKILTKWYLKYPESFIDTYFYSFDEVEVGSLPGATITDLNESFYKPAKIPRKRINSLTYANYQEYDQLIKEDGGLDIMMLGLGQDGHFCGNMPYGTDLRQFTYKLPIKEEYPWYRALQELFPGQDLPEYFVTMGMRSLMKVKHLILIVNGKAKAEAVKKMLTLDVTNEFPATALLQHPNLTIILDQEAAQIV